MWRMCRISIFPRWHANRKHTIENKNKKECSKAVSLLPSLNEKRYSDENSKRKQRANKQENFWNDPHFRYNSICSSLVETASWVGTAVALCLNIHHRHYKTFYHYEGPRSSCILSKFAFAMPQETTKTEILPPKDENSLSNKNALEFSRANSTVSQELKINNPSNSDDSIMQEFENMMLQYVAAVENSTGCQDLNSDEKSSFNSFKAAAQLGSGQGFYNLGLCYEQGKGTEINLNKAAYCYRQAVIKGHGLASYNLAIYFLKGWGDLPVDSEIAKELMLEAAEQNVPEAKLFLGLEYIEKDMWTSAFAIFTDLAKNNNMDGKYYLGVCYENGWGIKPDEILAMEMFSQAAAQGHVKATVSLGRYYEEGRGGCDKDVEFAMALYQTLAGKGYSEGRTAIAMLKKKLKASSFSAVKKSPVKPQRSILHTSASVPELTVYKTMNNAKRFAPVAPQYLDLILPFIPLKSSEACKLETPLSCLNDKKTNKCSTPMQILPYFQSSRPRLMAAKT